MQKICIPFFLLVTTITTAQINSNSQWKWMKGDSIVDVAGVYGIQGIASATNKPRAISGAVSWTDALGNLWLFGGYHCVTANNYCGRANDHWKYDPSSNMWTWMKGDTTADAPGIYGTQGIAASTNKPGARDAAFTWTDASGNLWLFGGYGWATNGEGELNDLWKYAPSTNIWTWMKGDSILVPSGVYGTQGIASALNIPPPRAGGVTWTDGLGNLWLFGGETDQTFQIVTYNDLWKYDPATNMWTWMKGDNTVYGAGIYGTQGVGAPSNKPGARSQAFSWKGTTGIAGTLWLFGGRSINGNNGYNLNDLWKYDISTNEWTWIKGDNTVDVAGIYGSQGTPGILNKPGARRAGVTWTDALGSLWLFGGYGFAAMNSGGGLNDLWNYDPSTNQWTWVKGDNITDMPGIYGTQGIPDLSNKPGVRGFAVSWKDAFGNLWLFGGSGFAASNLYWSWLNDLWKLNDCTNITSSTITASACSTYTLNGQTYTATGVYTQTLINSAGCDSIITLNLTINNRYTMINAAACVSYIWNSQTYTSSGIYKDTIALANGCDSIITLSLVINSGTSSLINAAICPGQNYGGYISTGTYIDTLVASNGCDSIRTLNLTVKTKSFSTVDTAICSGQNYAGYTISGTYTDIFVAANGCDSVRRLNLTIKNNCGIYIPNSFTPNNDGLNDLFKPTINLAFQKYRFIIFNRYGKKIFETYEYWKGWDGTYKGKEQAMGSYVYRISFTNINGYETENNGTVLLIR